MSKTAAQTIHPKYKVSLVLVVSTLLLTTFGDTDGYTLTSPENDHFQDYTRAEMEAYIGEDRHLLGHYRCDGARELDPYALGPIQNENKDSLRIRTSESGDYIVYREGKYYRADGSLLPKVKGSFPKTVEKALAKIEALPSGAKLLRLLESGRYPLVITYGGWMMFSATEDGKTASGMPMATAIMAIERSRMSNETKPQYFHQIGVGGNIVWDPESSASRIESDGVRRPVPSFVALGHEMYHAWDGVRGLLDRRFVWGDAYESNEIAEFRAVYFENQLRRESGRKYAKYYGDGSFPEKDVLDVGGQPIAMPAPCLKD